MISLPFAANPILGGMKMLAKDYWQIFLDTGAPEFYLLYNNARKMEKPNVFDDTWLGASDNTIQ